MQIHVPARGLLATQQASACRPRARSSRERRPSPAGSSGACPRMAGTNRGRGYRRRPAPVEARARRASIRRATRARRGTRSRTSTARSPSAACARRRARGSTDTRHRRIFDACTTSPPRRARRTRSGSRSSRRTADLLGLPVDAIQDHAIAADAPMPPLDSRSTRDRACPEAALSDHVGVSLGCLVHAGAELVHPWRIALAHEVRG